MHKQKLPRQDAHTSTMTRKFLALLGLESHDCLLELRTFASDVKPLRLLTCRQHSDPQVKRNVQRTLATELQKLSVQFRKQQKQHLNRLRQNREGAGPGSWLDTGPSGAAGGDPGDEYDPGFTDIQVIQFHRRRTTHRT